MVRGPDQRKLTAVNFERRAAARRNHAQFAHQMT
jgi:hypothetical protein